MGFSGQGYWSGLPCPPPPGDIPEPGMEPRSPALQTDSLLSEPMQAQWVVLVVENLPANAGDAKRSEFDT